MHAEVREHLVGVIFPSTIWVLGTELRSSALATSVFMNCTFSLAYYYYVHISPFFE